MSRALCLLASAALLASVGAFAQSNTAPSPNATESNPPAAAPAPEASSSDQQAAPTKAHHRRHMHASRSGRGAASDWDADKLNACMPDANPTPQQLACMRQARS
jgi:hypothetical protein